jgi:hypothetical protein
VEAKGMGRRRSPAARERRRHAMRGGGHVVGQGGAHWGGSRDTRLVVGVAWRHKKIGRRPLFGFCVASHPK